MPGDTLVTLTYDEILKLDSFAFAVLAVKDQLDEDQDFQDSLDEIEGLIENAQDD